MQEQINLDPLDYPSHLRLPLKFWDTPAIIVTGLALLPDYQPAPGYEMAAEGALRLTHGVVVREHEQRCACTVVQEGE